MIKDEQEKNMCLFCRSEKDGDIPNDHECLIDEEFEISDNINIGAQITEFSFKHTVNMGIWADVFGDEITVCLNKLSQKEGEEGGVVQEFPFRKKINFCPMCGRELNGQK